MAATRYMIQSCLSFNSRRYTSSLLGLRSIPTQQARCASILANLSDHPGALKKRTRVGRGASAGKGKTSGRGHKGQGQRGGKIPKNFEGGQTPLHVVKGKRGFENVFSLEMSTVNVNRVQSWIDQGRLDPSKPITVKELVESRCLHGVKHGVKLLGDGAAELRSPINILVSRASASAIAAVEKAGGSITTRYYTWASIRRILKGESDPYQAVPGVFPSHSDPSAKAFPYRLPDPSSRRDIEYYRDPAHRGYLSHLVPEGDGPSLFFKTPKPENALRRQTLKKAAAGAKSKEENRVW